MITFWVFLILPQLPSTYNKATKPWIYVRAQTKVMSNNSQSIPQGSAKFCMDRAHNTSTSHLHSQHIYFRILTHDRDRQQHAPHFRIASKH